MSCTYVGSSFGTVIAFPLCGFILDNLEWEVGIISKNISFFKVEPKHYNTLVEPNYNFLKFIVCFLHYWKFWLSFFNYLDNISVR